MHFCRKFWLLSIHKHASDRFKAFARRHLKWLCRCLLFDLNLSKHPFLGQVVNLDLLLCTGFDELHAELFPCLFFHLEINEWSKDWEKRWVLLLLVTSSWEIHRNSNSTKEQNPSSMPKIYKALKLFDAWTKLVLPLSWYHKSDSTFLQRACSKLQRLQQTKKRSLFVLAVRPAQAVQERCPKSLAIDFAIKTFNCLPIVFWNSLWEWWPDYLHGLEMRLKLKWTLQPDQRVVTVLSAQEPLKNLCGDWIVFRSVEGSKIKAS